LIVATNFLQKPAKQLLPANPCWLKKNKYIKYTCYEKSN
jgi:hypothetical protein